ncbi:MAG: hypothetical protein WDN25_26075 [Acetobacteraceae bacterium]
MVRRIALLLLSLGPVLAGCTPAPPPAPVVERPGLIALNQGPPSDVPIGGGGRGTVFFRGTNYGFAIGGLGIDGSAVAIIRTTGQVYRLEAIAQFAGTYRQVPGGAPLPETAPGLWLRNEHAVLINIQPPPQGILPALNGDALRIVLD